MEKNTRSANCKLCECEVYEDDCIEHMVQCVEKISRNDGVLECWSTLQKYYILLYIIGYIGEWKLKFPLHLKSNYLFMLQIYEHFHHLKTNTLWRSTLLESDNFVRLVLSVIEFPEDHYLQIPPTLTVKNFDDSPVITNLKFLFTRTQILNLTHKKLLDKSEQSEENLSVVASKAKEVLRDLKAECEALKKIAKSLKSSLKSEDIPEYSSPSSACDTLDFNSLTFDESMSQ